VAVDLKFVLTGAKRVADSRPMYAQVVVTDDCNLSCSYCDEYSPGAPLVPLETMKARVDKLDELGVLVYDFLGGETLLHPGIAALIAHVKSKRGGSNLATIITNGFLLTKDKIEELNEAGLDFMQVSVDTLEPSGWSDKSLKSILPKLKLLAATAKFQVEIQSVLNEVNLNNYDDFRSTLKDLPFAFGFSIMHGKGGRIAIQGERYLGLLEKYGVFEGVNFYGEHLKEMLRGDFSRPWKCLGGFKFLYVTSAGTVLWCAQQRGAPFNLMTASPARLKENDIHKPCEAGCALGCVRMVSHTLGEPLKTCGSSLRLALGMSKPKKVASALAAAFLIGASASAAVPAARLPAEAFPSAARIMGGAEDPLDSLAIGEEDLKDAVASPPNAARLQTALRSRSALERLGAVREAARPRDVSAVPHLAATLLRLNEPTQIRAAAALALGRIGDAIAVASLAEALHDPSPEVRYAAALSLGRMPNDGVTTRLERVLRTDPSWKARFAAAVGLGRSRKDFAAAPLADALAGDCAWQVRQQAARSLQDLPSPRAIRALTEALRDPEPSVRAAAGTALAGIGGPEHKRAVAEAMSIENDASVRTVLALAARR